MTPNYHPFNTTGSRTSSPKMFLSTIALVAVYLLAGVASIQSDSQRQATSHRSNHGPCLKSWIHVGQMCYRITSQLKNYETSKSRCTDLSAQLLMIDDDSMKEREAPMGANSAILISHLFSDSNKPQDPHSKQYYVNISQELLKQHFERQKNGYYNLASAGGESYELIESDFSELWLPNDDPALVNLTASVADKKDPSEVGFALAYSQRHERWGLIPVSATRKLSFICARSEASPPTHHQATNQPATPVIKPNIAPVEPKKASDLNSQPSIQQPVPATSVQPPNLSEPPKVSDKEITVTTPQPEASSLLFRDLPHDLSVVMGSTAELRCSALESESTLTWTFNGNHLPQSNRVKVHPNGTLRIEHVRIRDDGNYTCSIQSSGSSESRTARLELIELPHQPEYITAELLDKLSTSVRVKWTPGFNGNSPITKYLVEMKTVNSDNFDSEVMTNSWETAKANISADQTSVIIPDLKPARKYIFRIRATNRVGTGDPSFPSRPPIEVPVQPPSMPPENLAGTPKSSVAIMLQWQPPPTDSQNGVIKGYSIRHKLAGYATDTDWYVNKVPDTAHLSFVLEDLIVWQNYEIQIAAENDKGIGPFSQSIFVRTKEGIPDKPPQGVSSEAVGPTSIKVHWNPPPPKYINGVNRGYKVELWYDFKHSQLAKEVFVDHNSIDRHQTTTIDGLLPYTEYHITVKCLTNAGQGPPDEDFVKVRTRETLPEAVASFEFADVLDKSLRLIWKPPHRINGELDHYTVEYSEKTSTDKKILKNYPSDATEAKITDLIPQTSYIFRIFPYNNIGQGPGLTNSTTTNVPPVLPEPPSSLIYSSVGSNSVTIQFNPGFDGNASIEKWIVEALIPMRGEHPPRWHQIYTSTNHSQGNTVVVRNLQPHTRYKLRLTPVNVVGSSKYPSESTKEFQTLQMEPEQPPKDLTIDEVKSNSVIARWTPLNNNMWLGNPRGYNLAWSESNNSSVVNYFINDTRADSCLIRDLEEFTEYTFRIYAVNEVGSSRPSEPVSILTLEDVPASGPTNVTAHAISSTAVSVDWNLIPKRHRNGIIRGYKIQYQAMRPEAPLQHKTIEDNTTRHVTLNDLKAFTHYRLAVAGFTTIGDGVFSSVMDVQTLEDTPGKPQNLSFPTVSQTSARVLWDPPEDPNGDIQGYKVSWYQAMTDGSKEVASHELHQNERTFKATNLKPDTPYVFTVTAKTKEGWGQQNSQILYTYDSQLRANLPFFRESWFVILCACSSVVITIIVTALLFIQTKSYKYKQGTIKTTSQDRLGDAGFTIDDDPATHYSNGFGLMTQNANHRRSNGALSQNTANFTLPKTPPRPHPGSVVYSDDGDDDVFDDVVAKPSVKSIAGTSNYDSSGDSLTEKPSEISSSTAPESESADDEYVNMANKHFVNHYANVSGTLRGQKMWKKQTKQYSSHRTKPKLPQRPAPSVPKVPGEPSSSGSDNSGQPVAGTSGMYAQKGGNSVYGESHKNSVSQPQAQSQFQPSARNSIAAPSSMSQFKNPNSNLETSSGLNSGISSNGINSTSEISTSNNSSDQNTQQQNDLLNSHIVNLNGGRIIVDNMAGSRAPLPGFTSFV